MSRQESCANHRRKKVADVQVKNGTLLPGDKLFLPEQPSIVVCRQHAHEPGRICQQDFYWSPLLWTQASSATKMGLILPRSARVFLLTYQTVLGVRYPELVKATADGWKYGRYVSTEATLQGGFLPVFWDVPKSINDIGALVEWLQANIEFGHDSANNLAVLHNQNRMVDDFGLSAWSRNPNGK